MEVILEWDFAILEQIQRVLGGPFSDRFWNWITIKENSIPLYLLVLILVKIKYGWKNLFLAILFFILIIGVSDQVTNIFKEYFQRLRPCHDAQRISFLRPQDYCGGMYSFFSGHASNSFAFAYFAYRLLRPYYRWAGALFFWGALMALSRVYLGVHFPTDILMGTLMGLLWGMIGYAFWVPTTKYLSRS